MILRNDELETIVRALHTECGTANRRIIYRIEAEIELRRAVSACVLSTGETALLAVVGEISDRHGMSPTAAKEVVVRYLNNASRRDGYSGEYIKEIATRAMRFTEVDR